MILLAAAAAQGILPMSPMDTSSVQKQVSKQELASAIQAQQQQHPGPSQKSPSQVMVITPQERALDLHEAYSYLKTYSPASQITVHLKDGKSFSDIMGMDVMKNGTMIIFKTNTVMGIKLRVVPIDEIDNIGN